MNARSSWSRRFGEAAEEHASRWLRGRGLSILARNYRCAGGEIDIVAQDGELTVIVEVKARSSTRWGSAGEAVGWRKRSRIRKAARNFLWERGQLATPVRFDVISIDSRGGKLQVDWIQDAFRI